MSMVNENSTESPARLPVHRRKRKVSPSARQRVIQACNGCNVRKAKCSGGQPCERCYKASRECVYPSIEKTISVPLAHYEALEQECDFLKTCLAEAFHSKVRSTQSTQLAEWRDAQDRNPQSDDEQVDGASPELEGRILADPDGTVRYLGESSGATFLNHLREYMATTAPLSLGSANSGVSHPQGGFLSALGRYQTHDSRPLLTLNVDPSVLADRYQAESMFLELQFAAQDGAGEYASGGIYFFVDVSELSQSYQEYLQGRHSAQTEQKLGTFNAAFAVACLVNPSCAPEWASEFGRVFFSRARNALANPLDASILGDANALALLTFYLLNNNRRDAAYHHNGAAIGILIVHGVHRAWLTDEPGKRLFWTLYILDRWLSCLMGRPTIIVDEAIKLDLPRDLRGLPSAVGLRAHVELARISDYIVSNIYDVARQRGEPRGITLCIHKALDLLKLWCESLPQVVKSVEENLASDRAVGELHMHYNQLLILALRPLLFHAVKKATMSIFTQGQNIGAEIAYKNQLDLCVEAAKRNICLWRRLLHLKRSPKLSHFSTHYLFNAGLTLQLYQILAHHEAQTEYEEVAFVISVLNTDESGNMENSKDCAKVLSDLRSLVWRLVNGQVREHEFDSFDLANFAGQGLPGSISSESPEVFV